MVLKICAISFGQHLTLEIKLCSIFIFSECFFCKFVKNVPTSLLMLAPALSQRAASVAVIYSLLVILSEEY